MDRRTASCQGCLLGLAVGDAMGHPINEKNWDEIREDYGPNGLLGYDLVNGFATGSAYTQVAAYAANGLLLGITRGREDRYLAFMGLALREWARAQHFPRDPEKSWCWVAKLPLMRGRKTKDSRMLDALRMETLGTMERPSNRATGAGSLTAAVAVGLACGKGMQRNLAGSLGAQVVALTHGDPETFLCGSVLAESVASILENEKLSMKAHFAGAIDKMCVLYSIAYPQADALAQKLRHAIEQANSAGEEPREYVEKLGCDTAAQCLCTAVYACCLWENDFDNAMILSVNHSGRSAAVGSLTGALLGAKMGVEALPEFYLESLEPGEVLKELATDLAVGSLTAGLFDDDWDHKYVQGLPVNHGYMG